MSENGYRNIKKKNKLMIPIILMMGFVPLLVHMYSYNANLSQFDWFPANSDTQTDFFFAWKMIGIIVIAVVMVGILVYKYYVKNEKLKFENSFYLLFVYALFVAMSALFSNHKYWVVRGTYELFEPVWVVFAYIILCYYVYNFVNEEHQVNMIIRWSGIGITVVTLIGVFQYFGKDFFKTSLGKHLITNSNWWNQLDSLQFNFADKTSYTTLYNPNFLSLYFGMLIPLFACLIIGTKKWWHRVALVVVEAFCIICLKGSGSDTGWMAIVLASIIIILVLLSRKKKLFITGIAVLAVGIVILITIGTKIPFVQKMKDTILGTYHFEKMYELKSIETNEKNVIFNVDGNKVIISYNMKENGQMQIFCKDENANELQMIVASGAQQITQIADDRYEKLQVQPVVLGESTNAVRVQILGSTWDFVKVEGEGYFYCNPSGKLVKYQHINAVKWFKDDAMSNRGHIWNLTIPILKKHIIMGAGANTFLFEYPQNDYMYKTYKQEINSFDVKAHSWYLQQWVESGLLGLLMLMGFVFCYLIQSIHLYRHVDLHNYMSWVGIGLFLAVGTYLFAAVTNDSNVCTAPVFWSMLGLGLAVNRMLMQKNIKYDLGNDLSKPSGNIQELNNQKDMKSLKIKDQNKKKSKKMSRKQRKNQK